MGIILVVVYFQIMGWFALVVNFTAMTFLTVMTIPQLQTQGDFKLTALALALGVVYFGVIFFVVDKVQALMKGKAKPALNTEAG